MIIWVIEVLKKSVCVRGFFFDVNKFEEGNGFWLKMRLIMVVWWYVWLSEMVICKISG